MKTEILTKLEKLLETDNIFSIQQEFKQLSAQFKNLIDHGLSEDEEIDDDEPDDAHYATEAVSATSRPTDVKEVSDKPAELIEKHETTEEHSRTEISAESDPKAVSPIDIKVTEQSETQANNSGVETTDTKAESKSGVEFFKPEPKSESDEAQSDSPQGSKPESETVEVQSKDTNQVDVPDEVDTNSESFDEARKHFVEIQDKFKQRIEKARNERKRIEQETIQTAKDLLEELRKLVENEENIGKAFNGFNAIQEKWKSLPRVSNDAYRDLNIEYNKFAEQFFYNINIYKELKELDLKHNLDQKLAVIEDQKNLLELRDIRRMEVEVRLNQDRWNEIGPTFKEEWDKIKDEFWNITRLIYKKIQDFYNERRAQQESNFAAKEALVTQLNHILSLNLKSHSKWQDKTREVIDLQKQWKMVGYVPKEKVAIWKEFKKGCDQFFENKRNYHNELRIVQDAHRDAKQLLLDEAEALKDSTDKKETSRKLIRLQKEWKKIGAANQRDEKKLWKKFRAACDHFFQNLKAQKAEEISEHQNNLIAKQELLKTMEAFEPGTDSVENVAQLKEFASKWREIGHVPFKAKDELNKTYKKLLDQKFKALKIDKKQKDKIRFEQKIEDIKEHNDDGQSIRREQDAIRGKISKLKSEKIQLENNMGFFANSKGANKLKAEIEQKVDKIDDEINVLKSRLTLLRNV